MVWKEMFKSPSYPSPLGFSYVCSGGVFDDSALEDLDVELHRCSEQPQDFSRKYYDSSVQKEAMYRYTHGLPDE